MTAMIQGRYQLPSPVMTREEVRAFDTWAIQTLGIPGVVLMENAGRACAEHILKWAVSLESPRIRILCGTGNNGGDGYVIARHLLNQQINVRVLICGDRNKVKGDALVHLTILKKLLPGIDELNPKASDSELKVKTWLEDADVIVDALFGTGLRGPLSTAWINMIDAINDAHKPVVSVDIPSGLDCDLGQPLGAAVRAKCTVSFVALKKGFVTEQAKAYTGEVVVASIGVTPSVKKM